MRKRVAGFVLLLLVLVGGWGALAGNWGVLAFSALILFVVLIFFPWLSGSLEHRTLTNAVREREFPQARFVALNDGVTHYEFAGPEEGPKVVLVVGLASGFFIWDHQFHALAEAGFRVLRYDNFGRGLSDRPRVRYGPETFGRQLLELLNAVGWTEPVDLVGLSMGGATVARFVAAHPERVRRYVLIAPAGLPGKEKPNLRLRLLLTPWVGDWLFQAFGDEGILKALPAELGEDKAKVARAIEAYHEQMQFRGYKRAMLQTIRHNPLNCLLPVFEAVGKLPHRGLLIWGTQDTVVPFDQHVQMQEAIPGIEFHAIEGGAHPVCYQKPEAVNPLLIHFLMHEE